MTSETVTLPVRPSLPWMVLGRSLGVGRNRQWPGNAPTLAEGGPGWWQGARLLLPALPLPTQGESQAQKSP